MKIRAAIHGITAEDVKERLTLLGLVAAQAAGLPSILQRITFGGPSPSLYWNSTKREIELEIQDYNELLRDGGRSFYKGTDVISLVARNRHSWESLSQLRNVKVWPDSSIRVCQKQRLRWQVFREWQRDSRGIKDSWVLNPDIWLVRRLQAEKRECLGNTPRLIERLARYEANPDFLMQLWYQDSLARDTLARRREEESGYSDIDSHTRAVTIILKRNGLDRNPVLLQDPKDQDRITEWIEYTAWEYLQMEDSKRKLDEAEQTCQRTWDAMQDSSHFGPEELTQNLSISSLARESKKADEEYRQAMEAASLHTVELNGRREWSFACQEREGLARAHRHSQRGYESTKWEHMNSVRFAEWARGELPLVEGTLDLVNTSFKEPTQDQPRRNDSFVSPMALRPARRRREFSLGASTNMNGDGHERMDLQRKLKSNRKLIGSEGSDELVKKRQRLSNPRLSEPPPRRSARQAQMSKPRYFA